MMTWTDRLLMLATVIPCLIVGEAQAQTVWRCGSGGASYSDLPCPGEGFPVSVADARSSAEVQAARAVAARESQLAERLAAEARRQEPRAGAGLAGIRSSAVLVPRSGESSRPLPAKAPFTVKLAKTGA